MRAFLLALFAASVQSFTPATSVGLLRASRSPCASYITMGPAKDGPFTPLVKLTKSIMGKERFLPFRAKVIAEHTKVIQAFVETADSPFGCMALKQLFELADVDGNGTIDRDELKTALRKLGFTHLSYAQIDKILERAYGDDVRTVPRAALISQRPSIRHGTQGAQHN